MDPRRGQQLCFGLKLDAALSVIQPRQWIPGVKPAA